MKQFDDCVEDSDEFMRSGFRLTHGDAIGSKFPAYHHDDVDTNEVVSGVATSEGASMSTSEVTRNGTNGAAGESTKIGTSGLTNGAASEDTNSDTRSIDVGSLSGVIGDVPSFSQVVEFFKRLKNNYQGVKT
ncbi:hypothetical protein AXG93_2116s1020 [Marchantia polymorpha subsp. ruderalis]|uniref:Uncharacterized protein n=1 Tax=Marchantia polymorpha subsp. ruderalis TaxID=1480154 RepID=A0A176VKJ4_MARPO|nr:hypothetical protein AXG93_2116s1020 [Marchantia polymorpha subsp. ruderalis]